MFFGKKEDETTKGLLKAWNTMLKEYYTAMKEQKFTTALVMAYSIKNAAEMLLNTSLTSVRLQQYAVEKATEATKKDDLSDIGKP